MKPADISFRIPTSHWMDPENLKRLLGEFDARPGLTDELSLFTSFTHPPLPLDEFERRMTVAAVAMVEIRKHGLGAGINVLATIGHHEEDLSHALGADFPRGMDIHGRICGGSLCPTSSKTEEYVKRLYTSVAASKPDFVWVDDDLRLLGHLPIRAVCFCDNCLRTFGEETGADYDRDALHLAFNSGPIERKIEIRCKWLDHNRRVVHEILALVESTVHQNAPTTQLGFMTGERFYEGYDFAGWAETLAGPEGVPVRWRPGGGFYTDRSPELLLEKAHEIGRQTAAVRGVAYNVQAELENFPYQRLSKSERITMTEAAADIAAGCTGVAFNVTGSEPADLQESLPLFDAIHRCRPFYDRLSSTFASTSLTGIRAAWNSNAMATTNLVDGDWLEGGFGDFSAAFPASLYKIGIPPVYDESGTVAVLLKGDTPESMSDTEIESLLSGGIYLDATALALLCRRGFSELVGFEPGRSFTSDCIEELTGHRLNGGYSQSRRDVRQSFWPETAVELMPIRPGCETLSSIIDYADAVVADTCLGVFENRLGGRIAVCGYAPWTLIHSRAKVMQLRNLFRWLTSDRIEAFVASYHRVSLWVGVSDQGGRAVMLVNSCIDHATGVKVALRGEITEAIYVDMNLKEVTLHADESDGRYQLFTLPEFDAWDVGLLLA